MGTKCPSEDWDDYCTAQESPWEKIWDRLYEEFPWVGDLVDSELLKIPMQTVQNDIEKMVNWTCDAAYSLGTQDAAEGYGERIDDLEQKLAWAEAQLDRKEQHDEEDTSD